MLAVMEGGVEVKATALKTTLKPALTVALVPPGSVKACINAVLLVEPLTIVVSGFYRVFACVEWEEKCCGKKPFRVCIPIPLPSWCPKKSVELAKWSAGVLTVPLFDICNDGGKGARSPQPAKDVAVVQASQTGVMVTWGACTPSSIGEPITSYEVALETAGGRGGNVAPAVNVGSQLSASLVLTSAGQQLAAQGRVVAKVVCTNTKQLTAAATSKYLNWDTTGPSVTQMAITSTTEAVFVDPVTAASAGVLVAFTVGEDQAFSRVVKVQWLVSSTASEAGKLTAGWLEGGLGSAVGSDDVGFTTSAPGWKNPRSFAFTLTSANFVHGGVRATHCPLIVLPRSGPFV